MREPVPETREFKDVVLEFPNVVKRVGQTGPGHARRVGPVRPGPQGHAPVNPANPTTEDPPNEPWDPVASGL